MPQSGTAHDSADYQSIERDDMPYTLNVNGTSATVDVPADTPLLWVIRDVLDLKGTKFGCGIGQCGACTVHVRGRAVRSCQTPVSAVADAPITTLEGLLSTTPQPTDDDIDRAMNGNLCRCGTYRRIREAIHAAAGMPATRPTLETARASAAPTTGGLPASER
jgi:isoquinoline 1-oxidoreductase alpha subunit